MNYTAKPFAQGQMHAIGTDPIVACQSIPHRPDRCLRSGGAIANFSFSSVILCQCQKIGRSFCRDNYLPAEWGQLDRGWVIPKAPPTARPNRMAVKTPRSPKAMWAPTWKKRSETKRATSIGYLAKDTNAHKIPVKTMAARSRVWEICRPRSEPSASVRSDW